MNTLIATSAPEPDDAHDVVGRIVHGVQHHRLVLDLIEAVGLLIEERQCLQEHATDLGEVAAYTGVGDEVKRRHVQNVMSLNMSTAKVHRNPICSAAIKKRGGK